MACATLVHTTTRRRSHRSTRLPANGPSSAAGASWAMNSSAVATPEPVVVST